MPGSRDLQPLQVVLEVLDICVQTPTHRIPRPGISEAHSQGRPPSLSSGLAGKLNNGGVRIEKYNKIFIPLVVSTL